MHCRPGQLACSHPSQATPVSTLCGRTRERDGAHTVEARSCGEGPPPSTACDACWGTAPALLALSPERSAGQAIAWRVTAQLVPACSKATQQALCVSASNLVSVRAQAELLRKLKAHLDAKTTQAELKRSLDDVRVVAGHLEAEKAKQQEDATPTRCGSAPVPVCAWGHQGCSCFCFLFWGLLRQPPPGGSCATTHFPTEKNTPQAEHPRKHTTWGRV